MAFECLDAGSLLVSLAQLRDIEQPGLGRLVKGGGEYEVASEKDPTCASVLILCQVRDQIRCILLYAGGVALVDEQALAGRHVPLANG